MGGRIAVGAGDDDALLGEGWGPRRLEDGAAFRETRGWARVLAPLDVPEDLEVEVRAASSGADGTVVTLIVNGREAGRFLAEEGFADERVRVPAAYWRRELNDVILAPDGGDVRVHAFVFRQLGREP
jgi:hypothetical protein